MKSVEEAIHGVEDLLSAKGSFLTATAPRGRHRIGVLSSIGKTSHANIRRMPLPDGRSGIAFTRSSAAVADAREHANAGDDHAAHR